MRYCFFTEYPTYDTNDRKRVIILDPAFPSRRFAPPSPWLSRQEPIDHCRHTASYDMSLPPPASQLSFVATEECPVSRSIFVETEISPDV